MGLSLQYTCPKCGYQTPDESDKDCLIWDMDMESCYVCTCNECHRAFNRGQDENGNLRRTCKFCGSPQINIHPFDQFVPCPVCHHVNMKVEVVGTFF